VRRKGGGGKETRVVSVGKVLVLKKRFCTQRILTGSFKEKTQQGKEKKTESRGFWGKKEKRAELQWVGGKKNKIEKRERREKLFGKEWDRAGGFEAMTHGMRTKTQKGVCSSGMEKLRRSLRSW